MFKKKRNGSNASSVGTILGKETKIEGKLTAEESVRIDGSFVGEVDIAGDLVVGEAGQVRATVQVHNLLVVGAINGDVVTSGQLEIAPTGIIKGDIETARLIVEAGGLLQGHCKISVPEET